MKTPKTQNRRSLQRVVRARCEGWRRTGIFQMGGTGRWEQCKNPGIVTLKFKDGAKMKTLPACKECWAECLAAGVTIIKASPLRPNDSSSPTGAADGGERKTR